jgi:magnesium transporter
MLLDLKFSILTLAITAGTFVAALYGMNLKNFIEESDFGFYGVSGWCTIFGAIVAVYGLRKLRQVQRVSMYAHGPGSIVSSSSKGGVWGLGAWGGRTPARSAVDGEGLPGLKRADSLGDLIQRERALSRKLARNDTRVDDIGR